MLRPSTCALIGACLLLAPVARGDVFDQFVGDDGWLDEAPGAAKAVVTRAVVNVIGVDQKRGEAAIKGPKGAYLVVPVLDPKVLATLKEGDTVIMTYAEAVIVSLKKSGR